MTLDELDKLAAEKLDVMAHETYDVNRFGYIDRNGFSWEPTRNIAQAWECWEASKHRGNFEMHWMDESGLYYVTISGTFGHWSGVCQTAPEAIVRACLKAKGIEC